MEANGGKEGTVLNSDDMTHVLYKESRSIFLRDGLDSPNHLVLNREKACNVWAAFTGNRFFKLFIRSLNLTISKVWGILYI